MLEYLSCINIAFYSSKTADSGKRGNDLRQPSSIAGVIISQKLKTSSYLNLKNQEP